MTIRLYEHHDLSGVIYIWNESVHAQEVVYYPLTAEYFHQKFELNPNYDAKYSFVADEDGQVVGFISGVAKKIFLTGETNESTPGYLTCIFVRMDRRGRGIGKALVETLDTAFKENGKTTFSCSSNNPINIDWTIPGTSGHDHNNAPGIDESCAGYGFLRNLSFKVLYREIAMYLDLSTYVPWAGMKDKQRDLLDQGIYAGRYDARLDYDYDVMCERVGSEYWRSVLQTEIACHKQNIPCTDLRFIPNGKIPAGPRPILAATHEGRIVGFTGPVDRQDSGRGWFSGICTDPLYERRGIASVLFNLLMQEFVAEGATFSTLFTGDDNHAQRIYRDAGFHIVRRFTIMSKDI